MRGNGPRYDHHIRSLYVESPGGIRTDEIRLIPFGVSNRPGISDYQMEADSIWHTERKIRRLTVDDKIKQLYLLLPRLPGGDNGIVEMCVGVALSLVGEMSAIAEMKFR
ncbi:hypothetical protein J6590_034799 [Homalodisca vitripennis]|nr:hypothetical protein J6590_034799 [Homalodisca vitripennis]